MLSFERKKIIVQHFTITLIDNCAVLKWIDRKQQDDFSNKRQSARMDMAFPSNNLIEAENVL